MRIGVFVGASTADLMSLDELIGRIKQAEDDGFDSFWVPPHLCPGLRCPDGSGSGGDADQPDRAGRRRSAHVSEATPWPWPNRP